MLNIKVHPALKPITYGSTSEENKTVDGQQLHVEEDKQQPKELNTLTFYKHRLDRNTLKAMFMCLAASPNIHTLK